MKSKFMWKSAVLITCAALVGVASAADVTVSPAAGNSFVVRDAGNSTDRLRVNENGQVTIPLLSGGTTQASPVCSGAGGLLGPCASSGSGFTLPFAATQSDAGTLFSITNSGAGAGIAAGSNTGSAALFSNSNIANVSNTVQVTSTTEGVIADHSQGNAGNFFTNNVNGVGAGVRGEVNSQFGNNGTAGVYGVASGTGGYGGYFEHSNASGFGLALEAITAGLGVAAHFETLAGANAQATLEAVTAGVGNAAVFTSSNINATANILQVTGVGPGVIADHSQGNAGNFFLNNSTGVGAGVRGEVNSIFGNNGTAGVYGVASGTGGYGGYFEHTDTTGFGVALEAITSGLGVVGHFETVPAGNDETTLESVTAGTGSAGTFSNVNPSSPANTLNVTSVGPGVIADHSQGNAGNFFLNNTAGVGAGVRGEVNSIFGNNGTAGVYGVASGTGGYGGYFEHSDSTGFGVALQAVQYGQGYGLVVDIEGPAASLAVFQNGGFNVARIDDAGKGYFDGGTAASGADVAEYVPTAGATPEPGDVVEIDPDHADTFRLASQAGSVLVAGVISTKPGVTLNDRTDGTSPDSGSALALAGRVPVKVTNAGGAIHIGDLLVASSVPGHAQRATDTPAAGSVIGKALQNFDDTDGTVSMLVWAH